MRITRLISLLFLFTTLITSSVAYASMPCCMDESQLSQEMPCHEESDKTTNFCDCKHQVQLNILPASQNSFKKISHTFYTKEPQNTYKSPQKQIYQPPKIAS